MSIFATILHKLIFIHFFKHKPKMMKKSIAIMAAIAITGAATAANDGKTVEPIGKSDIKIEGGLMTPEALWAMGRIGEVSVAPDAKSIVYGVS